MAKKNTTFKQLILWLVLFCTASLLIFMFIIPQSNSAEVAPGSSPSSQLPVTTQGNVSDLTRQDVVVNYLIAHQQLPDFYLTKKSARHLGWDARAGNLCDVLPGKAIGGDIFTNRQKLLPVSQGRVWYEADINYQCGHRGADRVVYSNDGLIYVTTDHYKSFLAIKES